MNVEYRSDLQNSYMVVITENQNTEEFYALRMITENHIVGLLSCERKLLNNNILYYYDVTEQISLEDRCKNKKIQGQEILLLLNKLLSVLSKLEEYLLSEKSICLIPQYIYVDENMEQVNFCYVPEEDWDFQVQLRELMEYLLPYLDHNNQESMMIGYGMYHYILREKFTVDGLYAQLSLYHRIKQEDTSVAEIKQEESVEKNAIDQEEDELWKNIWEDEIESDEKNNLKKHSWIYSVSAFIVFAWALIGWFLWRNFKVLLWVWGVSGIFCVVILMLCYIKLFKEKPVGFPVEYPKEEKKEMYTQVLNDVHYENIYILKNETQTITLKNKKLFVIGRDERLADIVLPSNVISRKHGQIRLENGRCFLMDLYSKNGIRVNGVQLMKGEEIELQGGEQIQFADINYSFYKEN